MIIAAIDISSIFKAAWEAAQGKEFGEAQRRVLELVARLKDAGATRIVCACDHGLSFRRALDPAYKANRPIPDEAYLAQLGATLDRLQADGATVWLPPRHPELTVDRGEGQPPAPTYLEADDLLAGIARWWVASVVDDGRLDQGARLRIVTRDRDLWALVDDALGIEVINPNGARGDQRVSEAEVKAHFGVPPSRVWMIKALAGDTSDNFDPYPGLGDKTAAKLVQALPADREPCDIVVAVCAGEGEPFGVKLNTKQIESIRAGELKALERSTSCARLNPVGDGAAFLRPLRGKGLPKRASFDAVLDEPVQHELVEAPEPMPTREGARPVPRAGGAPEVVQAPSPTTAIVPASHAQAAEVTRLPAAAPPGSLDPYALEPATPAEAVSAAQILAEARIYPALGTWQAVFGALVWGRALGQPMGIALANAHAIKGQLAWKATFQVAVVRKHPSCLALFADLRRCTDQRSVVLYQRAGVHKEPQEYSVTIQEAHAAGWASEQWKKRPKVMLIWAAFREVCRLVWGDVLCGVYGPDEIARGVMDEADDVPAELVSGGEGVR